MDPGDRIEIATSYRGRAFIQEQRQPMSATPNPYGPDGDDQTIATPDSFTLPIWANHIVLAHIAEIDLDMVAIL
jgi:hypothetical protein